MQLLALHAHGIIVVGETEIARAQQLEERGISAFDALHVACAEGAGVDIFLTTDDQLLHRLTEQSGELSIRALNPLAWVREVG